MENIIRSNAVKIASLGSSLGILSAGKASIKPSVVALAQATVQARAKNTDTVAIKQQPSVLLLGRGVEGARIVIWVWIGKMKQVGHVQINNSKTVMALKILTVMTPTAIAVAEAQATLKGLVKVGCFLQELHKLWRTIEVPVCGY